ncbi:Ctr copper transporter [Mycena floridula]|nr:Ctr copper transporter [Mycena floridula]
MDMHGSDSTSSNSSSSSSGSMMMMKAYLHFTSGDTLLFDTIVPSSAGAVVGACFVLFFISVLERYLCAYTRGVQQRLQLRSNRILAGYHDSELEHNKVVSVPQSKFILSHELARGVLTGLNLTLHYLLMLVVMTFNAGFIISVIFGAVVGDVAFGRLNRQ